MVHLRVHLRRRQRYYIVKVGATGAARKSIKSRDLYTWLSPSVAKRRQASFLSIENVYIEFRDYFVVVILSDISPVYEEFSSKSARGKTS